MDFFKTLLRPEPKKRTTRIKFNENELKNRLKQIDRTATKLVKNAPPKCKHFCKKEYLPPFKKIDQEAQKQLGKTYTHTIKKKVENERIRSCVRMHCNPECKDVYLSSIKHKDGWTKQFSKSQKQKLQQKGALSGCSKDPVFMKNLRKK